MNSSKFFVPEHAPPEDQIICSLINQGLRPRHLLKAAITFYQLELSEKVRAQSSIPILSGLFKGMLANTTTLSSVLLPKYLGTYELELQKVLVKYASNVNGFVDIGCAEGYYVNGIAYWLRIPSIGVDINPVSESLVLQTAVNNNLHLWVKFRPLISEALALVSDRILILVDVDGSEIDVLKDTFNYLSDQASLLKSIRNVLFIIETDYNKDGTDNTENILELLSINRCKVLTVASQNPLLRFSSHTSHLSFLEQCVCGLEGRAASQKWIIASWIT